MAKKRIYRNKRYFNTYAPGGLLGSFASWNEGVTNQFMNSGVGGALGKLGVSSGGLGGIANGVANMANSLMNPSGNETGVGNALSAVGSLASNIPGVGGVIGAGVNLVGGLVNAAFGSNINEEYVADVREAAQNQRTFTSDAKDNESLLSDWSSYTDMAHVSQDDVGSDGWFSNKAKNLTKELNADIDKANRKAFANLTNAAWNVDANNDFNIMSSFAKNGGPIHIKKKNRGKFTEYCGGKVTSECIARGKRSSSPTIRKRATFAANARKWHHADGGPLFTHGGIWSNGMTYVNNGGTHEENPFEGVPMGIAPDGQPNLVEEGEVIFNDYVFSNRLKVPKDVKKRYKIHGETYADAAKELGKESQERPNDPISNDTLEAIFSALTASQEEQRMKNENRKYAKGGKLGKKFDGTGPDNNWLDATPVPLNIPSIVDTLPTVIDIDDSPIDTSKLSLPTSVRGSSGNRNASYLRYAPAIASGLAAFSDIFSKPDYSAAETLASVPIQPFLTSFDPVGQYLSYRPFDRLFYINQLNANAGATRRAIRDTSGGNRAAAMASLLSADYNYGQSLGSLARQAEEYNQAQRERVATFNRATDMYNSDGSMKAQTFNAQARENAQKARLAQAEQVARLRMAAKEAYDTRRSSNLNNFINSLAGIGQEAATREMINSQPALYYQWLGNTVGYKSNGTDTTKKKGGKLKKRRRFEYA